MTPLNINLDNLENKILALLKKNNIPYLTITELDNILDKYELLYLFVNLRNLKKIGIQQIDTKKMFVVSDVPVPYVCFVKIGLI